MVTLRPQADLAGPVDHLAHAAAIDHWIGRQSLLLEELYIAAYLEGRANFAAQFPERELSEVHGVTPDPEGMAYHRASVAKLGGELHRLLAGGAAPDDVGRWFDRNEW